MVTGSFPEGAAWPNIKSAKAGPAIVPPWKAYKIPSAISVSRAIVKGRPAMTIMTTGFPVCFNAASNSVCLPGRPISALQRASPDKIASSPTKANMTSACSAVLTAFVIPSSLLSRLYCNPGSATIFTCLPYKSRKAVNGVTALSGSASKHHVPNWSAGASANGPTTAIVFISFFKGSTPLFFNNTALSIAARFALASDSAV